MYDLFGRFTEVEKITSNQLPASMYSDLEAEDGERITYGFNFAEADTSIIDFFGYEILAGNRAAILNTPNSVVIRESKAKIITDNYSDILGRHIYINNRLHFITGVIKNLPSNSSVFRGAGFVFNTGDEPYRQRISKDYRRVFVVLGKNVKYKEFESKFNETSGGNVKIELRAVAGSAYNPGQLIILAIGFLVLLAALSNYVSFQTSQFYNRLRECAMRKVSGAGMTPQFLLFFTEIAVVIILSGIVGYVLIGLFYNISGILGQDYNWTAMLDEQVLVLQMVKYTFAGILLAALFCIVPTIVINRLSTKTILLGMSAKGGKRTGRTVLLGIQLFIFLGFMFLTVMIQTQVATLKSNICENVEDRENILVVESKELKLVKGFQQPLLNNITASPLAREISYSASSMFRFDVQMLDIENNGQKRMFRRLSAAPGFSEFMDVRLLSGELLSEESLANDIIISEQLASMLPEGNPVGRSVGRPGGEYRIVGVYKTIQLDPYTMNQESYPSFINICSIDELSEIYVKIQPGKGKEAKEHIEKCVREYVPPQFAVSITSFDDKINALLGAEKNMAGYAGFFAAISLILSLLSIYSTIAMSVEKRRKEVAIRKINGAKIRDIIMLFGKNYVVIWTVICIIEFPLLYYFAAMWRTQFTQKITLNPAIFIIIYIGMLALIFATVIFRILRVARLNPAEVIKK
jgi:ABC-type antimicrobial peptide transport system permease subunit